MKRTAFIFMVNQSEESAEGNSCYSSWKVWARRLELWTEFLYYSELRHAHMPTVVVTSVGQVIVCSSNVYTPFLHKRLPSGCVSFVGEWEHRRPSYVIHVSFEQHETKRCTTRSIVRRNIVLIPFSCCIDRTLDFYSEVRDAILDYTCGRPDCPCVFNP